MKLVEDFIRVLYAAADGRSRVEIDLLWRVFLEWKPELAASPTKRAELERLLTEAANTGKIALPKGRKLYDRTALPSLPLWVVFPVQKDMTERFDHKSYPWSAPMSFVAGLPRIPSPEDALAWIPMGRNSANKAS